MTLFLCIVGIVFILLLVYGAISVPKSPYDQELEDQDQIKWLQNYKK